MWTVVCRNVNRACSRLTTDSQHHIRLTAQRNVETAETDRISLLNWCNPWIMHLNLSRWWVLYLLHLLWMNSSALVSFFSAALGRKKKENSNLLTLGICRDDNVTSVWRGELASCVAFITSENTCCCLSSSLFLVLQISSSSSRSPKRHPPSAPHSPLLLPLHFIDSIVFSLCSIFCLSHLRSLHTLHLVSLPILLPLSFAPLPPSLSLSFSSVSAGVSLSPLGRVTRVCVSGLPERGGLNEVTSRASRTAVFVY